MDTFLNTKDPKELNEFVISIMNPYKKDDMDIKIKAQLDKIKEKEQSNEKRYRELKKINKNLDDLSIKNFKITNELINENINLSKNIYDKIEKGMVCHKGTIPKKSHLSKIISLFDVSNSEKNMKYDNKNQLESNFMDYKEVFENQSYYNRKNSDSDFSDMDINVDTKV